MRRTAGLVALCAGLALPLVALAHGSEKHEDPAAQAAQPAAAESAPAAAGGATDMQPAQALPSAAPSVAAPGDDAPKKSGPMAPVEERTVPPRGAAPAAGLSLETLRRDLNFTDFPTLHPMAVHVPVSFIPLALLFALLSLFSRRRIFPGLAFGFTLGGLAGGFVAAFPLHPHTTGLSPAARETLAKHDLFAYGTLWLALFAALVGLACLWKPGALRKALLCLALLAATLAVSITAHYGGTLAYVHGVGVQGRYLMQH